MNARLLQTLMRDEFGVTIESGLPMVDDSEIAPVSYTHLDVYKRQVYTVGAKTKKVFLTTALGAIVNLGTNLILVQPFGMQGIAMGTCLGSVSYTHLDVYKRQTIRAWTM